MSAAKPAKGKGLGRGFDALLPQDFDDSILWPADERVQKIKVENIKPNLEQPRRQFDDESITQLASSIKQYGVLQPIILTLVGDNKYILVAGERRWRAAKEAGINTMPAIVRSSEELERLEISLIENIQRVDLSPLEQAASIERLHHQFNMTYETIAQRLGKAISTIINTVRLLQLPVEAQKALHNERITEGHARAILALKLKRDKQFELLRLILKNGWSVRQAERFVTALKASAPDTKISDVQKRMSSETPETKSLSKKVNAPVSIRRTAKGGKLEIGFTTETDLQRLLKIFLQNE